LVWSLIEAKEFTEIFRSVAVGHGVQAGGDHQSGVPSIKHETDPEIQYQNTKVLWRFSVVT
jgi:hypothetical protein